MRIKRAIALQTELVNSVNGLVAYAAAFHSSHDSIHTRFLELTDKLKTLHAPEWVRQYVRGYYHAKLDSLYAHDLVYGGTIDGVFYSTHRNRADYYESHGIEPREFGTEGKVQNLGHYWTQDTSRPFFISPSLNKH